MIADLVFCLACLLHTPVKEKMERHEDNRGIED